MSRADELMEIHQKAVAGEYEKAAVSPDSLAVNMRVYPRESVDMARVSLFAEAMHEGQGFPAVWVAQDRKTVIDGAHRVFAARQLGLKTIDVQVLPVSDLRDIVDLSVLANTSASHMPLQPSDLKKVIGHIVELFREEQVDIREGIKSRYGGIERMARFFSVPSVLVTRVVRAIETVETAKAAPPHKLPKVKRKEVQQEEWTEETTPTLPENVVRTVLATPPHVEEVPKQSEWDYVLQATLRLIRAFNDAGRGLPESEVRSAVVEAAARLPDADRAYIVRYRERLIDLVGCLDELEGEAWKEDEDGVG